MGDHVLAPLDEASLSALIRQETPRLFRVVRSFTEQDDDVEDLLQQLWLIVLARSHRRNPAIPMGAWLHSVALNLGRSHYRRNRRREWLRLRWSADLPELSTDIPTTGEVRLTRLWRTVAALPNLQRDVVLLRVIEGLSTREVAERLGRAEGTVKASLHRALRSLRQHLLLEDVR